MPASGASELSENDIQRAVFKHLDTRAAHYVFAFHPKNGSRDMRGRHAGMYTGLGVRPGIPDVIIFQGVPHKGAWPGDAWQCNVFGLELKRASRRPPPGSKRKLTDHERQQAECHDEMRKCGAFCYTAYGLDDALQWLEAQDLLAGKAHAAKIA